MIYILAYIVLGISTGVWTWLATERGPILPAIITGLVWPVTWIGVVVNNAILLTQGKLLSKCAWCGKPVAGHKQLKKWRSHYLNDCDKHPLAIKCARLERYLDETDARYTALRVRQEELAREATRVSEANDKLEAEVAPLREMMAAIKKRATRHMDEQILRGKE